MIHPEAALAALWAKDEAPEVDPAFELAVAARIGRRQILKEVGEVAVWAAPAGAVTWAVWPSLSLAVSPLLRGAGEVTPVLVIVAATAFALWSAARLFSIPGVDFGALEYFLPRGRLGAADDRFD